MLRIILKELFIFTVKDNYRYIIKILIQFI